MDHRPHYYHADRLSAQCAAVRRIRIPFGRNFCGKFAVCAPSLGTATANAAGQQQRPARCALDAVQPGVERPAEAHGSVIARTGPQLFQCGDQHRIRDIQLRPLPGNQPQMCELYALPPSPTPLCCADLGPRAGVGIVEMLFR